MSLFQYFADEAAGWEGWEGRAALERSNELEQYVRYLHACAVDAAKPVPHSLDEWREARRKPVIPPSQKIYNAYRDAFKDVDWSAALATIDRDQAALTAMLPAE